MPAWVRAQAGPANLHASITVATDTRHWGLSQIDSGAALRASVDYEHDSGWFAGAAVGNVEYGTESWRSRPRELKVYGYLGVAWRGARWSGSVALARNAYPDVAFDYDYTELVASVAYRSRVFVTATRADDLASLGYGATHLELATAWPIPLGLEVGAGIGRVRAARLDGGYTHWNVGVSRAIGRFVLDLRRYDGSHGVVTRLGDPAPNEWAASVSYALAPRN